MSTPDSSTPAEPTPPAEGAVPPAEGTVPPPYTPPAYTPPPAYTAPPAYTPPAQPAEPPYGAGPTYGAPPAGDAAPSAAPGYGAPAAAPGAYPPPYQAAPPAYGAPAYGAPAPAYGYGYAPARTNTLAIVSLVASIVGFLWILPFIGNLAAVITGHISLKQIKQTGEGGRGMALAGVIVGWVGLAIVVLVGIIFLSIFVFAVAADNGRYS
ncbi:hypothetical protein GCM10009775_24910 [Microbacterium aoyamense]|uniref:DUF4190 domain-containing protein n=1 Tax=Microbacterium aoyamense TaxID=344166 RepID=A0ABN2PUH0_9MICO|nr:DUF4190 domain-containing protein [Microbacterium aoyamense]